MLQIKPLSRRLKAAHDSHNARLKILSKDLNQALGCLDVCASDPELAVQEMRRRVSMMAHYVDSWIED